MPDELALVRRRLGEIDATENNLRAQLDLLSAERKDLSRVEEILTALAHRFRGETTSNESYSPIAEERIQKIIHGSGSPKRGTARPEGIPTVAEMVDTLLRETEERGKKGLTGQEIVKAIDERWWPGVDQNNILPTALRHVKQNRLGRDGPLYVRLKSRGHHPASGSMAAQDEAAGTNPEERMPTASITGADSASDQP
ncbi:hypothetical protein ACN9MF_08435 [Methylobacterium fujisawaense]|uniref:hypothetical protein n=1 Tax=Methylobacterium fujisawaense TaxID=107400 RepID=UPI003CEF4D34